MTMIMKDIPAEDWGENGVGSCVECHHHPVGHPSTLRDEDEVVVVKMPIFSHIFLVVASPHSLEGAVGRPKCPKKQPSLQASSSS